MADSPLGFGPVTQKASSRPRGLAYPAELMAAVGAGDMIAAVVLLDHDLAFRAGAGDLLHLLERFRIDLLDVLLAGLAAVPRGVAVLAEIEFAGVALEAEGNVVLGRDHDCAALWPGADDAVILQEDRLFEGDVLELGEELL